MCHVFGFFFFPQRQGSGKRDHKRQGSQDKIRVPRSSSAATETAVSTVSTNCTDVGQRRKRRKWITEKPNISLNLWSVMKNCIGKELSKIPMPVSLGANSLCVVFWYVSVCVTVCVCVCICVCWLKLFSPGSSRVITGIWRKKTHLQTL